MSPNNIDGFEAEDTQQPVPLMAEPIPLEYANFDGAISQGIRIQGKSIIFHRKSALPTHRCIKCNAPSSGKPIKRNLYWIHPAYYLLIFLGLLIFIIVALFAQKRALVYVGLCDQHRKRRRTCYLVATVIIVLSLAFILLTPVIDGLVVALTVIGGVITGLVIIAVGTPIVSPIRIDENYVQIRGAGQAYRDSLSAAANPPTMQRTVYGQEYQ